VLITFQPIAVSRFGWAEQQLAVVNFCSAAASIAVSVASAQLRLPEWTQVGARRSHHHLHTDGIHTILFTAIAFTLS
jgi:hypothetical protein